MQTIMKTKTKTATAVALVTLAVGGTALGLVLIQKNNSPAPNNVSLSETVPTSTPVPAPATNFDSSCNNSTTPTAPLAPTQADAEISCDANSAYYKGATYTGYARRKNGIIEYRGDISLHVSGCTDDCNIEPVWRTSGAGARCSTTCQTGGINTILVTGTVGGIKTEGTYWGFTTRRATCIAHWPDMNCPQTTTYAQTYPGQPCVKVASPCDVPLGMTVVDFSSCPIPATH